MGFDLHTAEVIDGSAATAMGDRIKVGLVEGMAIPTGIAGEPVAVAVTQFPALPSSYTVFVEPNGTCMHSVTNKTQTGFTVTFYPASGSVPVGATAFDAIVVA